MSKTVSYDPQKPYQLTGPRSAPVFGLMTVFDTIPSPISRLHELAYSLLWSWHLEVRTLYSAFDPDLWEQVGYNPVRLLNQVPPQRLEHAVYDANYLRQYERVLADFDRYIHPRAGETWFARTYPELANQTIAYFSAEFELSDALPIYSDGLGLLSGDHCKEASDLGLPFVGIGFLYAEGYFQQRITRNGVQEAVNDPLYFFELPALPVCGPEGNTVMLKVDLPGRSILARLWKVQVGRIPLYLMDTDIPHNSASDRRLTARLYGGDHEAREVVAANSLFTTHTPVAAGNDTFGYDLIDRYFWFYGDHLGITREQFLELAHEDHGWGSSYDIDIARYLVSGTDLWLNNPIRPYEASSTSGQKAALNGLPNCSILDGWWAEGYNGYNGWVIGEEREYDNAEIRDDADSSSLYALLEGEIIPTYYDRGPYGIPHRWVVIMKETIRTCAPTFSMRWMVKEYTTAILLAFSAFNAPPLSVQSS